MCVCLEGVIGCSRLGLDTWERLADRVSEDVPLLIPGILNGDDNCVRKANRDQVDTDGDGVGDACDNCVYIPNENQVAARQLSCLRFFSSLVNFQC